MPAKPPKPAAETKTFRSILFYGTDDANAEKVRADLGRTSTLSRPVTIADAVRYALALAAERS
jgi:hypothetical protein